MLKYNMSGGGTYCHHLRGQRVTSEHSERNKKQAAIRAQLTSQKTAFFNPDINYSIHPTPPLDPPVMTLVNPVRTLPKYFINIGRVQYSTGSVGCSE
jgi:hypothetical protein